MKTRSFSNGNEIVDWTEELNVLPNKHGTIQQLGLFEDEGVSEHVVQFEQITSAEGVMVDRVRGQRGTVGKDQTRLVRAWSIPHFNHDDAIFPSDVKAKRAYGSPDQEDTLAAARVRKMDGILRVHADTKELARCQLISAGTVYAPSGTVALNFFSEFGVTQKVEDFVFSVATSQIAGNTEAVIGHMLDNATGTTFNGVAGLASPTFFQALIQHARVEAAYASYDDGKQQPLRNRLGLINGQRVFHYQGVDYIEIRGQINGTALIPAGECRFVPIGSDIFKTYYSPANRFDLLGTVGEQMYLFEKMGENQDQYNLMSETNFMNACRKPQLIVRGTMS